MKRIHVPNSALELAERMRVDGEGGPGKKLYLVISEDGAVRSVYLTRRAADKEAKRSFDEGDPCRVDSLPLRSSPEVADAAAIIREIPTEGVGMAGGTLIGEERCLHASWECYR